MGVEELLHCPRTIRNGWRWHGDRAVAGVLRTREGRTHLSLLHWCAHHHIRPAHNFDQGQPAAAGLGETATF